MRSLKVWGITLHPNRCIVAAYNAKEAAALLCISQRHLRLYGSITYNEIDRGVALNKPLTVFGKKYSDHSGPYKEIKR